VRQPEQNHQQDRFEERLNNVRIHRGQHHHAQNRRRGALENRPAQLLQGDDGSLCGTAAGTNVRVADVGRKIDGKPDGHDQCDHGDAVQIDVPQRHEAVDAEIYGQHGDCDEDAAVEVGYEQKGNDEHGDYGCDIVLKHGRLDALILIGIGPVFVIGCHVVLAESIGYRSEQVHGVHVVVGFFEILDANLNMKYLII